MSKFCFITGKKPFFGNKRSHSMNSSKKKFLPNLHYHRIWLSKEKKFIKMKLSTKAIRIINKLGIDKVILKNKYWSKYGKKK